MVIIAKYRVIGFFSHIALLQHKERSYPNSSLVGTFIKNKRLKVSQ